MGFPCEIRAVVILHKIAELGSSGKLSDEEFEKARSAMIESVNPLKSENDADIGNGKPGNDENSQKNVN